MLKLIRKSFLFLPSIWINHARLLVKALLSVLVVILTVSPTYANKHSSTLTKDSIGVYVKQQLDIAKKTKNKDWTTTIEIMDNLLKNPMVMRNDSILNYVKYRHSLYLLMIDENVRSRSMILEILDYYQQKNPKKWTNLKSRLGSIAIRMGNYDTAKAHLDEALPSANKLKMSITEGLIYLYISNICKFKSDYGDAYRKADLALQIFQKIDREDWILEAKTSLAYICVLAKDYDAADLYFAEVFNSEKAIANDNFLVSPTLYSGVMNFEKGDIPLAKKQFEKGLAKINDLGNFPDLMMVYQYMSRISSMEKDYVAAEEYILKALAVTDKSYNKRQKHSADLTLIKLESIIKPKKDNLKALKKVYQWAMDNNDNILLKESSHLISSYYIDKGDLKKALTFNQIYINASEEKFQLDRINEIAIIKEKGKFVQEVKEREMKAQQLQLQLASSEARRNMMLGGMLFFLFMSGFLLYFYTQNRKSYASLKISNQELKKAETKMDFKNKELEKYIAYNLQLENFAYIASHDLKSPLRTISNFSTLLQKTAKDRLNEEELQYLTFISKGTDDMSSIVNDILDFSILQKSELIKEEIEVSEFVDYVLQLNQSLISEKNATISLDLKTPIISGDRSKLLQLLQNLITNSVKFQKKDQQPKVVISSHTDQNNWVFNIKDNGIGIEPSYFNKIFLLFKRLHRKEEYEGTGIGLSMCKKIVEMHGGKIWVNSTVGEGSTFSFSLPK